PMGTGVYCGGSTDVSHGPVECHWADGGRSELLLELDIADGYNHLRFRCAGLAGLCDDEGKEIVADIAAVHLFSATKAQIESLLTEGTTLADAAVWPTIVSKVGKLQRRNNRWPGDEGNLRLIPDGGGIAVYHRAS